ncbi:MAG: SUMF1/EgtB/PvdO family nonheme iron enzyme [Spirochaetes bacterium]|nr:SUMF1/EgtB/PvdO family nonheme iron enzyme [Spirochaetota bacterium]
MKNIRVYLALVALIAAAQPAAASTVTLDAAIRMAVENLERNLPASVPTGQRPVLAVVNISSVSENLSSFIIGDLEFAISASNHFTAVDRSRLDQIRTEQNLQASGAVSDETMQSIGRWVGAHYVVTGDVLEIGTGYRILVRAINVESAVITPVILALVDRSDQNMRFFMGGEIAPAPQAPGQGPPQPVQVAASPPAAAPQPGQRMTSSTGIVTVRIPAGTFTMGSPENEIGRSPWGEGPQRQVTISQDFWMGVYPVTQEQWVRVMGSNPSGGQASNPVSGDVQGRRPVTGVSWYDAIVFANRLSIMEGLSPAYRLFGSTNPDDWGPVPTSNNAFWNTVEVVPGSNGWHLPTDAQWEYAARAGTTTAFSNGMQDWENESAVGNIGWFDFNSGGGTREVGRRSNNPWGLYDMHGNVEEWVWDWMTITHSAQAQTDPIGPSSGNNRVFRGGGWDSSAQKARSAARSSSVPHGRYSTFLGLRLARP